MYGGPPQPQIGPQMPPGMMDPMRNNQPLQFNMNKGKPPIPRINDNDSGQEQNMVLSQSPDSMHTPPVDGIPGLGEPMGPMAGPSMGPWGPMNAMMGPPNMMGMDPSMMMPDYNQYGGYMPMDSGPIVKEVITLKNCVLYPPPPNAPPPSTRERPPGCRTVFIGGLPELITEEMTREIFENCGPICSIRMSKKNFAHIRFVMCDSVERALYLSGYRIKVENQDDKANTGRIHVDYAQARDDLYEWECVQRVYAREERHRIRMAEEQLRPPSPPPIVHFSDHEATVLLEQLKGDDTFVNAAHVLITWLERGDCNRRSANHFYSMIQSCNAHVRRILNDKTSLDEQYNNMKIEFANRRESLMSQFNQVESIFKATGKQKAWDHFSKAQRKNLDLWRKQANDTIEEQRKEFLKQREEDEMEMSDTEEQEGSAAKKKKVITDPQEYAQNAMIAWQSNHLSQENDSLKCQLEAYKNEVDLLKLESKNSDDGKDKQVKALQQALQGMQQQLIQSKQQMRKDTEEVATLKTQLVHARKTRAAEGDAAKEGDNNHPEIVVVSTIVQEKQDVSSEQKESEGEEITNGTVDSSAPSLGVHTTLPEKEARILALLSTFLHVHPFGASLDYIWSYLNQLEMKVRSSELEDLLERYPALFKQSICGIGASIEKRWKFTGFETSTTPSTIVLV